jgi:hypothetical protein
MKRFVMRLTGEKSEVIYETRNTQKKQKKQKYMYIYLSCRARIRPSVLRNCFTLLSAALLYFMFIQLINRRTTS